MANFIVIEVDAVPAVDAKAQNVEVWLVNQADAAAAASRVADLKQETGTVKRYVIPGAQAVRYSTTPTLSHSSAQG